MSRVLILGPTRWKSGYSPSTPEHLARYLPSSWRRRGALHHLWPIDVRAALAGLLRSNGVDATLMEAEPDRPSETRTAKFARLVSRDAEVVLFVYWPFRANLAGLV